MGENLCKTMDYRREVEQQQVYLTAHFKRSVYTFCVRSHWMIPFNLLNGHSHDTFVSLIRTPTGN